MPSLPMPYHTEPPRSTSIVRVVILMVPPIEGVDTIVAPRPRWVWMLEATSERPAQLLWYTPPHSMSLIGMPLTIMATLALLKPRIRVSASPKPPP